MSEQEPDSREGADDSGSDLHAPRKLKTRWVEQVYSGPVNGILVDQSSGVPQNQLSVNAENNSSPSKPQLQPISNPPVKMESKPNVGENGDANENYMSPREEMPRFERIEGCIRLSRHK